MYILGDPEFKRCEGYRRSPRYLYRSTDSSLPTILAGTISVRLQYRSLPVNVRIRFLFHFSVYHYTHIHPYKIIVRTYYDKIIYNSFVLLYFLIITIIYTLFLFF